MANVILHGTINGYHKYPLGIESVIPDISVITDIRDEFNETQTRLSKQPGYLIRVAPNGVWFSIVKLMLDGERSGGGDGFLAISAYVPYTDRIAGSVIKQTLDTALRTYLSYLTEPTRTKSIGIDWGFLTYASDSLNNASAKRVNVKSIPYSASTKFAWVNVSDNQVVEYFDKPYQSEYGSYLAVFLGDNLIKESHKSLYDLLSIDLEDVEYSVIWENNSHWEHSLLPKVLKKNVIATGRITLRKDYYDDVIVSYKDGQIDDKTQTIIIKLPSPRPKVYEVGIQVVSPIEAIKDIRYNVLYKPSKPVQYDGMMLFYGEEVEQDCQVRVISNKQQQFKDLYLPFTPKGYLDKPLKIELPKLVTHHLKIVNQRNQNVTEEWMERIDKQSWLLLEESKYNKDLNSIDCILVENQDLTTVLQKLSLNANYNNGFVLEKLRNGDDGFYYVTIAPIERTQTKAELVQGGIVVNNSEDQQENREAESLGSKLRGFFNLNWYGITIAFGVIIIIAAICVVMCMLLSPQEPETIDPGDVTEEISNQDSLKLAICLEKQRVQWNVDSISAVLKPYKDLSNNPSAQKIYYELVWLRQTRKYIDTKRWGELQQYVSSNDSIYKKKWNNYVDADKLEFVRTLWNATNSTQTQRTNFADSINANTNFKNLCYTDVISLWGRTPATRNVSRTSGGSQEPQQAVYITEDLVGE